MPLNKFFLVKNFGGALIGLLNGIVNAAPWNHDRPKQHFQPLQSAHKRLLFHD